MWCEGEFRIPRVEAWLQDAESAEQCRYDYVHANSAAILALAADHDVLLFLLRAVRRNFDQENRFE